MLVLAFWAMFLPVVSGLFLIAFVVLRLCERLAKLERRCDDIDLCEDGFTGTIRWPIDDDFVLDGLRSEAGDDDDHRRTQLESVIRITERRH